jgi:hypothetical protein
MFGENGKHEMGIKKAYVENMRNRRISFSQRVRLRNRGALLLIKTPHLNRKVDRCYPRGKAWLRIVDLHSAKWCNGDGSAEGE